jgi:radical SAM protein with 4Fe4S-binding SPASM domain
MDQRPKLEEISRGVFWASLSRKADQQRVPVRAVVELTYGCNLRCVHCYNPTHKARGELATEQFYAILDQLAEAGCLEIAFTGGEMFTRRDCFEIFAYAKEKGFAIVFFTNATMIAPAIAEEIKSLAPIMVEVSIYGATRETYERVTRIPGSFPRFLRGVRLLRDRHVPLVVKMPVMTLNQHEVQQARALVEGWGIRFVYCTEIFPRVDGLLEPLQYRLAPQEVIRIDEIMVGSRKWRAEGGGKQDGACQSREGLFTCMCGRNSLAVTPYGQMNLCVSLPIPAYDLRTGTVREGWRTLVELVDGANAKPGEAYECPTCDLKGHCRQGPMNAWLETGRLDPCLPYFKELATLQGEAWEAARRVGKTD